MFIEFCVVVRDVVGRFSFLRLHSVTDTASLAYVTQHEDKDNKYRLSAAGPSDPRPRIQGSWGSKLDAVIIQILNIFNSAESSAASKILIFSGWIDVLSVIGQALEVTPYRGVSAWCTPFNLYAGM